MVLSHEPEEILQKNKQRALESAADASQPRSPQAPPTNTIDDYTRQLRNYSFVTCQVWKKLCITSLCPTHYGTSDTFTRELLVFGSNAVQLKTSGFGGL